MIVVDVETTGVDPHKHAIISVGALEFEDPRNEFYGECRIWEGAHVMEEAIEVNGMKKHDFTDPSKQSQEVLLTAFNRWAMQCGEHTLAGHNIWFDHVFLKTSAHREGVNWQLADRLIDDHSLVYMHMIQRGKTPPTEKQRTAIDSSFIQNYVGIPEEPTPHNALNGAKVAAEAISRVLYNKKLLPEFDSYDIPWI